MIKRFLACGIATWLLPVPAFGVTWTGLSTELPGTSLTARPELAGPIIASQTFTFIGIDDTGTLAVDNWVVRETSTGTLDFYYQIYAPDDTGDRLFDFRVTGFDLGPSLDVDFRTDLGGFNGFFDAARATSIGLLVFSANRVTIWTLAPHSSLYPMFVHTNATDFQAAGQITVLTESQTFTNSAFVPVLTVPEPQALTVISLGLAALAWRVRRR